MKKNLFALLLIIPMSNFAQRDTLPDPVPAFSAIIVSDMATSISWYSDVLGYEVLDQKGVKEIGLKQANLKMGSTMLELIELNSSLSISSALKVNPQKSRMQGFFKSGFLIDHFDDWLEYLENIKVEFNGKVVLNDQTGKRMVIIKDPDGNRIQLFEN